MSVKTNHDKDYSVWFVTFTCFNWKPLFEITQAYDSIYKWLRLLRGKQSEILAYVIMPNHLHIIIQVAEGKSINTIISNSKRFLAYEMVKRLKDDGQMSLLGELSDSVSERERKKG